MIHQISANESNIGDWMSAIGIRRLLPNVQMNQSFCDEYFLAETLPRMTAMARNDKMVIGGGGLFQEYFLPFWLGVLKAIDESGVQVCIWGVGVAGPASSPDARSIMRSVASRSRMCIVRDAMTREFLDVATVPAPVPCSSIVAAPMIAPPSEARKALLHAVHWDLVSPAKYEPIRRVVKDYAARTSRPYRELDNRVEQGDGAALRSSMAQYAQSDLIVSSRLHGCILGVALGCRVLALSSDPKVEAFMNAAGLGAWVCSLNDYDSIKNQLTLLPQQPVAHAFVADAVARNQEVAVKMMNILAENSKGTAR